MIKKTIQDRVIRVIAQWSGVSPATVTPSLELFNDLNNDSLDLVEILIELEDEFRFEIVDEDFLHLVTVQEVIDFVTINLRSRP